MKTYFIDSGFRLKLCDLCDCCLYFVVTQLLVRNTSVHYIGYSEGCALPSSDAES